VNVDERAVCLDLVDNARAALPDRQRVLDLVLQIDGLLSREEPPSVPSLKRAELSDELLLRVRNALDDRNDRKARRTVNYMVTYLTHPEA
jgi:hypothetical protein